MEEHEEKVSQMFNQKRVFDKGWDFVTILIRIPTLLDHVKANGRSKWLSNTNEKEFPISWPSISHR